MLRIALCDDEWEVREAFRLQLEKVLIEGSEEIVYEFSSGTNAVSWLRKHPGEVDLLFLDIEMKGLSGMETAKNCGNLTIRLLLCLLRGIRNMFLMATVWVRLIIS